MAETGRPSKYDPVFCETAFMLATQGATYIEIADALEVHVATYYRWRAEHQEFRDATSAGKEAADDRVEASLFHRAVGYSHDAVKIFMPAGATAPVLAPFREHYPPDTAAASLWLRNRRPEKWRDKVVQTFEDGQGNALVPVLNVIERADDRSGTTPKAIPGSKLTGH